MWFSIVNYFTKITAWPIQKLCFRTRILYEDKAVQGRKLKGAAMIVSNHTSIFDYAVMLFVFFGRTLRYQMAEVLFKKKILGTYLKMMGGIVVKRDSTDFGFMAKSADILERGGVVGVFPEGRLPREGEERPLPFRTGAAFLSLQTKAPIIPVYTDGSYFSKKRCTVIIGKPVFPDEAEKIDASDKEKIEYLNEILRNKIIGLSKMI